MSNNPLVIGAQGFLGSNLVHRLSQNSDVYAFSRSSAVRRPRVIPVLGDIRVLDDLQVLLESGEVKYVVNCAALADLEKCQNNLELAQWVNVVVPGQLAELCNRTDTPFFHVSTDAVFSGLEVSYTEDSEPHPQSVYGLTKRMGELAVLSANSKACVLRTNIVGWSPSGSRSLFEFFINGMRRGAVLQGFTDIEFRPFSVSQFHSTVELLFEAEACGIFHITGPELLSKFEFGQRIARVAGLDPELVVPSTSDTVRSLLPRARSLNVLPSTAAQLVSGDSLTPLLYDLLSEEEAGIRSSLSDYLKNGEEE
jgi:dTDP-4-dehydrorhamnose reductase